jgi:hypothetical protein
MVRLFRIILSMKCLKNFKLICYQRSDYRLTANLRVLFYEISDKLKSSNSNMASNQ